MTSWKTSSVAIIALIVTIGGAAKLLLDGDPSTNPDWNTLVPLIISTLTGLFARDNDKSSASLGIDQTPKPPAE